MREIVFFKTRAGKSPVEDYLDRLSEKEVQKVLWVLRLVKELPTVSDRVFQETPKHGWYMGDKGKTGK
ncbi:MAG: hypothetical protein WCH05_10185 [Chlorobiaceae bacterium]